MLAGGGDGGRKRREEVTAEAADAADAAEAATGALAMGLRLKRSLPPSVFEDAMRALEIAVRSPPWKAFKRADSQDKLRVEYFTRLLSALGHHWLFHYAALLPYLNVYDATAVEACPFRDRYEKYVLDLEDRMRLPLSIIRSKYVTAAIKDVADPLPGVLRPFSARALEDEEEDELEDELELEAAAAAAARGFGSEEPDESSSFRTGRFGGSTSSRDGEGAMAVRARGQQLSPAALLGESLAKAGVVVSERGQDEAEEVGDAFSSSSSLPSSAELGEERR